MHPQTTEKGGLMSEHGQTSTKPNKTTISERDVDQAYVFLENTHANNDTARLVDLARLRRRVDWRIVPIMFL